MSALMRRSRFQPVASVLVLLAGLSGLPAHAGLFDDAEARRQVMELRQRLEQKDDQNSRSLMELVGQLQALREENALLRGQIETLTYRLDTAEKRQQDFYVDIDNRLRKLEPQQPAAAAEGGGAPAPAASPADEVKAYEAGLALYQARKYRPAMTAFEQFIKANPNSSYAPNAQFWLGSSWYALGECKPAIDAHTQVVSRWPDSAKAPEALLAIAGCQQRDNNSAASRRTLETLISKYPTAAAAQIAQQRLAGNGRK